MKSSCLLAIAVAASACSAARGDQDFGSPRRVTASADGKLVALASDDKRVRVWDGQTFRLLHTLELDQAGVSAAFSADGATLVVGTEGRESLISAWSLAGERPKLAWRVKQIGTATALAIEPRGRWCASVTMYGRLNLYDLHSGAFKRGLLERGNGIYDLAIPPDGNRVVTVGQHLRVWDPVAEPLANGSLPLDMPVTDEYSKRFLKASHANGNAVVVGPGGNCALAMTAYDTGTGRITNLARVELPDGKAVRVLARGLDGGNSLAVSADGKLVAVGFESPKFELRSAESGALVRTIALGDFGEVRSLAFHGTKVVVSGPHGSKAAVWNVAGDRVRELWPVR